MKNLITKAWEIQLLKYFYLIASVGFILLILISQVEMVYKIFFVIGSFMSFYGYKKTRQKQKENPQLISTFKNTTIIDFLISDAPCD